MGRERKPRLFFNEIKKCYEDAVYSKERGNHWVSFSSFSYCSVDVTATP